MRAKATVRIPFRSEKQLTALVNALIPEMSRQMGIRSQASMTSQGQILVLTVEAKDTVALRAALNAYLRWMSSTMNVLRVVAKDSGAKSTNSGETAI